jgi:hypothetical protein
MGAAMSTSGSPPKIAKQVRAEIILQSGAKGQEFVELVGQH